MIKVIYDRLQLQDALPYFEGGDLSWISLDTETMGRKWYELAQELPSASEERRKVIEGEMKKLAAAKEAVHAHSNILATLQLGSRDGRVLFIVLKDTDLAKAARNLVVELMTTQPLWLIQNQKFDLTQLKYHWDLDFSNQQTADLMLNETLIIADRNGDRVSLDAMTDRYPLPEGFEKVKMDPVRDWWSKPLEEIEIRYGAMDVLLLPHIYQHQLKILEEKKLTRVAKLENKLTPALVNIERVGVKFDREKLYEFMVRGGIKLQEQEALFHSTFPGVNPNSPAQVLEAIEKHYGITPMKSAWDTSLRAFVKRPSADKDTLLMHGLRHEPAIQAMIAAKELKSNLKLAKTWYDSPEGRLMPSFMQLKQYGSDADRDGGTRTGRLSASPRIQNIQNLMKQFIVPDAGWVLLSADYSAIELRMVASYAGETVLKTAFNEGRDPHTEMAAEAFHMEMSAVGKKSRERRIAKEINFGFPFGMGGRAFCIRVLKGTDGEIRLSEDEGWKFRDTFFNRYPAIARWHEVQFAQACLQGYATTRSGRRREYNWSNRPADCKAQARIHHPAHDVWFDSAYATDWKWRNIAYNTPIQGSAADGMKRSLVLFNQRTSDLDWFKCWGTVHDSKETLVREDRIEEGARLLKACMVDGMTPYLPDVAVEVEVTAGLSWANAPKSLPDIQKEFPELRIGEAIRKVEDDYGLWFQTGYQEELKLP